MYLGFYRKNSPFFYLGKIDLPRSIHTNFRAIRAVYERVALTPPPHTHTFYLYSDIIFVARGWARKRAWDDATFLISNFFSKHFRILRTLISFLNISQRSISFNNGREIP